MSRKSEAKKARRKKRQAARWAPEPVGDEDVDAVHAALADVDDWVADRGWVMDATDFDNLVSWVYPPSAVDVDDESVEPVTRIWIAVSEDEENVMLEFGAVLVGTGRADDEGMYELDPDTLADDIVALETYRPGLPKPRFA